ncbi:MAG: zinc ribbon domain-containing protein [Candidatus Schekmanbacteria bacterium]|nr:zinc ribbon domain-containing protein [Candidatus Schekmanbacteria bacterium]
MRCPICGFANEQKVRFCGGCGYSLIGRCPACKAENSLTRRFCGACGSDIRAAEGKLEELADERRRERDSEVIEDELQYLKEQWAAGYVVFMCPHCNTKNRFPKERRFRAARCGRCREPIRSDFDS